MKYFGSTNSSVSKVAEKDGNGSNGVATAKFIFTTEQHTFLHNAKTTLKLYEAMTLPPPQSDAMVDTF